MARREAEERNEITLHDNLSGTEIKYFYRTPTTKEREGFNNLAVQRKGRKVKIKRAEAQLKYGLRILTGIREGDFERKVDGKYIPISSDPDSKNYYPDWKDWQRQHAADLVMLLGAFVFEGSAEIEEPDDDDIDGAPGEDIAPNSSETLPR